MQSRSGIVVRPAADADVGALAELAAATFPLACPPHVTADAIAGFVAANLSEERFAEYLGDPDRSVLVAEGASAALVGYTLLVRGEPSQSSVRLRPSAELSKCYTLAGVHGRGVGAALMAATLTLARDSGALSVWLGVNARNDRARRFYERQGFEPVGRRRFLVGDRYEDDHVLERPL